MQPAVSKHRRKLNENEARRRQMTQNITSMIKYIRIRSWLLAKCQMSPNALSPLDRKPNK